MNTVAVNVFAPVASHLASDAVAFINANKASDTASTPFARSALATIIGGVASLAMTESLIIAAMGSPKSPSTNKPIAKVSGLRDFDGGARLYQAWKDITTIVDNVDADNWIVQPGMDDAHPAGIVGANVIRPAVVAFILNEGEIKVLFGRNGLTAFVKGAMKAHAEAVALHNGVAPEQSETEGKDETVPTAPVSLSDRATAMLVAMNAASDDDFIGAQEVLALVADLIDTRWKEIEGATAPRTANDMGDAIETLADMRDHIENLDRKAA